MTQTLTLCADHIDFSYSPSKRTMVPPIVLTTMVNYGDLSSIFPCYKCSGQWYSLYPSHRLRSSPLVLQSYDLPDTLEVGESQPLKSICIPFLPLFSRSYSPQASSLSSYLYISGIWQLLLPPDFSSVLTSIAIHTPASSRSSEPALGTCTLS